MRRKANPINSNNKPATINKKGRINNAESKIKIAPAIQAKTKATNKLLPPSKL